MTEAKLVPVEPTEEMLDAARYHWGPWLDEAKTQRAGRRSDDPAEIERAKEIWAQMLSAAPVVGEPWGWVVSWDETPGLGRRIEMFTGPDWKAKAEERARDESTFPGVSSVEVYPVYRTAPVVGEPVAWRQRPSPYDPWSYARNGLDASVNKTDGYEVQPLYSQPDPKLEVAVKALERMMRAYVNLLEIGRDRIVTLGGDCDPVDRMEEGDPALIATRQALAQIKGGA